jgi:hypothetical protein
MNAGAINISVAATMTRFNESMTAVKTTAATKGGEAGKAFKDSFDKQGDGLGANFGKSAQSAIRGALAATAISAALKTTLEQAAQGAKIGDAIAQGIKAIPVIGAIASAVESALDLAIGASAEERMVGAARAMEAEAEKSLAVAEGRAKRLVAAEFELRRNAAREAGNERYAIDLEAQERLAALEKQFAEDMKAATRDNERKFIEEIFQAERKLIQQSAAERIKAVDEAAEKQTKANEERIRKEAEAADAAADAEATRLSTIADKMRELRERDEAERIETARRVAEAEEVLNAEREEAQTAGVGRTQTALGSFSFDAYPETEKRQNDIRIVRALEAIRAQGAAGGFS